MKSGHAPLQQSLELLRCGSGKVLEFRDQSRQILGFRGRTEGDSQMTAELEGRAQRVPLNDVGADGNRGSAKLIEQRAGPGMVMCVALLQRQNCGCVGTLPGYERPILVHGSKVGSRDQITASIKRAPYRTSPFSPLP